MKGRTRVCNKDCFHCPYSDCILDALDAKDYAELEKIEREILFPRSLKQKRLAAYQKAYREANREKIAAQQKTYREVNRRRSNQKDGREANGLCG